MIWVKRAITIPLGVLLVVELLVAAVSLQINESLLNPEFYIDELRKADIYDFVLIDLSSSAVDEIRALDGESLPEGLERNPLVVSGLSTQDIVSSLNAAIPPEWVQAQVEEFLEEVGHYITGDRDEFEVTVVAGDRVMILISELSLLISKADGYNLLFDELVAPAIRDLPTQELPFGERLDNEEMISSVRRIVPPEWIQVQVEAALDEVAPYVVGRRDAFEINVQLSDRVEIALAEVKELLRSADAYDLLHDEVIRPAVKDGLGDSVELALGLEATSDEILAGMRRAAPPQWLQAEFDRIIDGAGPFLSGKENELAVQISLVDTKRAWLNELESLFSRKLRDAVQRLPECEGGVLSLPTASGSQLPECVPPGLTAAQILDILEVGLVNDVEASVLTEIPDVITFTDADLRQALANLGLGDPGFLDMVRIRIRDGWTYTHQDLREDLLEQDAWWAINRLDEVRTILSDGWTYTSADLQEDLTRGGNDDTLQQFDRLRNTLGTVRSLRWLIYLPVAGGLLGISFLGARSWRARAAWAGVFLVAVSAIAVVASLQMVDILVEPRLEALRQSFGDAVSNGDLALTRQLAADKALEIAESAARSFASGLAYKSLVFMAFGVVLVGISLSWSTLALLLHRRRSK